MVEVATAVGTAVEVATAVGETVGTDVAVAGGWVALGTSVGLGAVVATIDGPAGAAHEVTSTEMAITKIPKQDDRLFTILHLGMICFPGIETITSALAITVSIFG